MQVPWLGPTRSAWLDEVRGWMEQSLGDLAPGAELECVRDRPWSIVLRAATPRGIVFFKAASASGRHEPGLVAELARRWTDRVAAPLAIDPERGWMLMEDLGPRLRDDLDGADALDVWERLIPRYAEIQLESGLEPTRWLELGVPDRRLESLPALLRQLLSDDSAVCARRGGGLLDTERGAMRALLPEFQESCHELAATPRPAALEHGDLHDGNVLVGRGRYWLADWGDTSLTHPFCSLLVTCNTLVDDLASGDARGRIARLRDAYLEPWDQHAPARSLRPLFGPALWVGHVIRALDWNHVLADTGPAARQEWQLQVAGWLRLWLERHAVLRAGGPVSGSRVTR